MTQTRRMNRPMAIQLCCMLTAVIALVSVQSASAQSGACCMTNGDCMNVSQLSCETELFGAYQGDGIECGAANCRPTLVINEIDYDQETIPDAAEFIELKNTGPGPLNLGDFDVVLVNGFDDSIYHTIDLPDVELAAGNYFVICANSATVPNCDLDVSPDIDLIQNDAPDAVAIVRGMEVIDALSYEGLVDDPYNEGDGITLSDPAVFELGLSRYPDGTDTDDSASDFSRRCTTPGQSNIEQASDCGLFRGACCLGDVCNDAVTILDCRDMGGAFGGDDSLCANVDCGDVGACCRADGKCEITLAANCAATGDTYFGVGTDCANYNCNIGACCLDNGTCDEATEASCMVDGGDWAGPATLCADTICPQPVGACCYTDGACDVLTSADCDLNGGVWQGAGTDCATAGCMPVTAACCMTDGSCENLTELSCTDASGTWQGAGSECTTAQCAQPSAACCLDNGSCMEMTDAECTAASGSWQGFGSDCASANCPQPQPVVGACCAEDGTCTEVEESGCNGTYQGDGTTCANADCMTPAPNPQPNDNDNGNTNDNVNTNGNDNTTGNTNDNTNDEPEPQATPGNCTPIFFLFQTLFGIPLCGPCVFVSAIGTFVGIVGMKRRIRRRRRSRR